MAIDFEDRYLAELVVIPDFKESLELIRKEASRDNVLIPFYLQI